jgi:ribosomal protein L11 methyltransferase
MNMMYPMPIPVYRMIDEEDWAEAWKAHYQPIRIGERLFIRPLWVEIDIPEGAVEVALDPGMAFGTGTHPTTQLCLEALENHIQHGMQVLDLGAGSAILSIAAAKLGAAHVLALDIDPVAVEVAVKNVEQNGADDKITAQWGSLENVVTSARRFDLIVVNILARIIIKMCDEHLGEVIRPGGLGIFSGIIHDQADDVEAALHRTGLTPVNRREMGDWVAIEAHRPHTN